MTPKESLNDLYVMWQRQLAENVAKQGDLQLEAADLQEAITAYEKALPTLFEVKQ